MEFQVKALPACVLMLVLASHVHPEPMMFSLDGNLVKTYKNEPAECSFHPWPCGRTNRLPEAIAIITGELDIPPPPLTIPSARKANVPYADDYELCPFIEYDDDTWLSFTWGSNQHTFLRFLDHFRWVDCGKGICDKYVKYNDKKFGCVEQLETSTFDVLWPANDEYIENMRSTGDKLKCRKGYCLVRIRIEYPASCKCAKRTWESVCGDKLNSGRSPAAAPPPISGRSPVMGRGPGVPPPPGQSTTPRH